jgi:ethanolamine-phosphate cytidylyltransferase
MLLVSREHLKQRELNAGSVNVAASPYTRVTKFIPSSRKIVQFSEGNPERQKTDVVVYVDGGFDLFHIGHIEFLRAAKAKGTYLIVGIHSDDDIHAAKGSNFPIMTLQERVLGVLSCRHVDEVIIGAPYAVTGELIDSMKINVVCSGATGCDNPNDAYKVARDRGIHCEVDSGSSLTSSEVIERILANYGRYAERNRKKEAKELKTLEALKGAN